jgi:hypothetical protein
VFNGGRIRSNIAKQRLGLSGSSQVNHVRYLETLSMVKGSNGFFDGQIRLGDPLMLALMFSPGFHDEAFNNARRTR